MSARDGFLPDVLWGQDSRASGGRFFLATAVVPRHSGSWTRWNSVHHHYLHPGVMRVSTLVAVDASGKFRFALHNSAFIETCSVLLTNGSLAGIIGGV